MLVKEPELNPSVVLLSWIVGFWAVLQQTPEADRADPPVFVIFKAQTADIVVILNIESVVNSGTEPEELLL